MNENQIKALLNNCSEEVTSDTIEGTWKSTQRTSLMNASSTDTRSNTSWKKAEFVVAFIKEGEQRFDLNKALHGWHNITDGFKNQYLIIEEEKGKWCVYDSAQNKIADENNCESFLRQQVMDRLQDKTRQRKSEFRAWLLQQSVQPGGDLFLPETVCAYVNAVDKIPAQWNQMSVAWECSDVRAIDEYLGKVYALSGWQTFNALLDNGAAGCCLEKYKEYLTIKSGTFICQTLELGLERQQISYGAPGTGKSHKVDEIAKKLPKEDVVRTTFHPDSDYSTFVGAYKPTMDCVPRVAMDGTTVKKATFDAGITANEREKLEIEKRISYSFVPQAFAKAYVQAWKRMAVPGADGKIAPVMLVIEEINRGDCAKVFGDLFQLLDRRVKDDEHDATKKAGFSEYPVLADSDLAEFIRGELSGVKAAIEGLGYASVVADDKLELMLPPNMYIWATMNTSDQSLFPMDSAFKRRWDWKYVPIKNHRDKHWALEIGTDRKYDWWDFLTKINEQILHATNSEDKQLGYFFVNSQGDVVSLDTFVNKVMFYLWNVVFKDCYTEYDFFKDGSDYLTFTKFFDEDGKPIPEKVSKFLDALKVAEWTAPAPSAAPATPAPADPATEGNSTEADAAVPQS